MPPTGCSKSAERQRTSKQKGGKKMKKRCKYCGAKAKEVCTHCQEKMAIIKRIKSMLK